MTKSLKLLARRGDHRFEREMDSAGKITGYLVDGCRFATYAEALQTFRALVNPARYPLAAAGPATKLNGGRP